MQETKKSILQDALILFPVFALVIVILWWLIVLSSSNNDGPSLWNFIATIKPVYLLGYIVVAVIISVLMLTEKSILSSCVSELDSEIDENFHLMEQVNTDLINAEERTETTEMYPVENYRVQIAEYKQKIKELQKLRDELQPEDITTAGI